MAQLSRRVLIDSDVLIEMSRKNEAFLSLCLDEIGLARIRISVISRLELLRGARNKSDFFHITRFLAEFDVESINAHTLYTADQIMQKYALSARPGVADVLIAATAIAKGYELLTINQKHFRFIEELNLYSS